MSSNEGCSRSSGLTRCFPSYLLFYEYSQLPDFTGRCVKIGCINPFSLSNLKLHVYD